MRYILENDTLRVEIESFGAEIKSVKRKADGRIYVVRRPEILGQNFAGALPVCRRAEEQGIPV